MPEAAELVSWPGRLVSFRWRMGVTAVDWAAGGTELAIGGRTGCGSVGRVWPPAGLRIRLWRLVWSRSLAKAGVMIETNMMRTKAKPCSRCRWREIVVSGEVVMLVDALTFRAQRPHRNERAWYGFAGFQGI